MAYRGSDQKSALDYMFFLMKFSIRQSVPHKGQEQLFLDQIITQKRFHPPPEQSSMADLSYKEESSVTCLIESSDLI